MQMSVEMQPGKAHVEYLSGPEYAFIRERKESYFEIVRVAVQSSM